MIARPTWSRTCLMFNCSNSPPQPPMGMSASSCKDGTVTVRQPTHPQVTASIASSIVLLVLIMFIFLSLSVSMWRPYRRPMMTSPDGTSNTWTAAARRHSLHCQRCRCGRRRSPGLHSWRSREIRRAGADGVSSKPASRTATTGARIPRPFRHPRVWAGQRLDPSIAIPSSLHPRPNAMQRRLDICLLLIDVDPGGLLFGVLGSASRDSDETTPQ